MLASAPGEALRDRDARQRSRCAFRGKQAGGALGLSPHTRPRRVATPAAPGSATAMRQATERVGGGEVGVGKEKGKSVGGGEGGPRMRDSSEGPTPARPRGCAQPLRCATPRHPRALDSVKTLSRAQRPEAALHRQLGAVTAATHSVLTAACQTASTNCARTARQRCSGRVDSLSPAAWPGVPRHSRRDAARAARPCHDRACGGSAVVRPPRRAGAPLNRSCPDGFATLARPGHGTAELVLTSRGVPARPARLQRAAS